MWRERASRGGRPRDTLPVVLGLIDVPERLARDQAEGRWPRWPHVLGAAGMLALVVAGATASSSPRPHVFIALLLVAASPWIVQAVVGFMVPAWVYAIVPTVPVLVINLFGDPLDLWHVGNGNSQVALLFTVVASAELAGAARWPVAVLGVGMSFLAAWSRWFADPHYDSVAVWTGAIAVAVCAGLLGRFLLATIYELQDAQAKLESQARSEERSHIAREIHDVIAHSLTVTMLQLGAARLAAERNDHDELDSALREAEDAARTSLNDVRRTVGLLGQNGGAPPVVQPDARDLLDLVDQYRAAGMDVRIDIAPSRSPLDAVLGLVVYRVVQESLANAAKHAPGASTTVTIRADDEVVIEVRSRGGTIVQGPGSRRGLSGMEQRVHALKGRISAGPCADGWDVLASLPRHLPAIGARR